MAHQPFPGSARGLPVLRDFVAVANFTPHGSRDRMEKWLLRLDGSRVKDRRTRTNQTGRDRGENVLHAFENNTNSAARFELPRVQLRILAIPNRFRLMETFPY